jgi:hypothetical protein
VGGYRLTASPGEVDAPRFAGLVAPVHAAAPRTTPAEASRLLPSRSGCGGATRTPMFAPVRWWPARLCGWSTSRLLAIEECVAAKLDLGAHGRLVGELSEPVRAHAFRERVRGQLKLAVPRTSKISSLGAARSVSLTGRRSPAWPSRDGCGRSPELALTAVADDHRRDRVAHDHVGTQRHVPRLVRVEGEPDRAAVEQRGEAPPPPGSIRIGIPARWLGLDVYAGPPPPKCPLWTTRQARGRLRTGERSRPQGLRQCNRMARHHHHRPNGS